MMEFRPPVTLEGRHVRLVPLSRDHAAALMAVATNPEIWTWVRSPPMTTPEEMGRQIGGLLEAQAAGTDLAFTVTLRDSGTPIGMTRYLGISRPDRAVEIGGTWYGQAYWRTAVNTDSKLQLLAHAFEVEGAHRVQLKTDVLNLRSQRAIERIGGVREGVLREHLVLPSGRLRSSAYYSILEQDWPQVRLRLEEKLARPWSPGGAPA